MKIKNEYFEPIQNIQNLNENQNTIPNVPHMKKNKTPRKTYIKKQFNIITKKDENIENILGNINQIINNSKKKVTNDLNKITDSNNNIKTENDYYDIDNNIDINNKNEENNFNTKLKDKKDKLNKINILKKIILIRN